MRCGIITPVLTLLPGAHARWEADGTLDDVAGIACAADRLGLDHLTCSEHMVVPTEAAAMRGGRYWDPAVTLAYLAAVTTRIRLVPSVVVLGYHHPLALAKRYATLDQVSAGRLVLGVGVGSLEEEFDLLGADFEHRGERADDAIRALRAAWSGPGAAYDGPWYRFADVVLDPAPVQDHVPLWVGGRSARSLRRAVELGDGWCPFGIPLDEVARMLDAAADTVAWDRRRAPLDVVLQPPRAVDPGGDPAAAEAVLAALADAGATTSSLRIVHHSPVHYVEQLEALVGLSGVSAELAENGPLP